MEDRRAHERIDYLEDEFSQHRKEYKRLEASLIQNTKLIEAIEANTKELVTLFRGAVSVRTLFVWVSPIVAGIAGLWAFITWLFKG